MWNVRKKSRELWNSRSHVQRERIIGLIFAFFFSVGTAGHYIEATRRIMLFLTPGILLIFATISIVPYFASREGKILFWILPVYLITFTLEAVGVATGAVFGEYVYGETLGLQVFSVPVIIGYNWVIVVLGCALFVRSVADHIRATVRVDKRNITGRILVAVSPILVGALAVIFDLVLEPVAIRFDYWSWADVSVPTQNYLAWFLIAATVSIPITTFRIRTTSKLPIFYVAVQFLFLASLLPLTVS